MRSPRSSRDMLRPVSKAETHRRIAAAQQFLSKHKRVFTHHYYSDPDCDPAKNTRMSDEALEHSRDLDLAAKWLMAQGGKIPTVMEEILRIHEKLGLLFTSAGNVVDQAPSCFYTISKSVHEGLLDSPIPTPSDIAEVIGWTVWRSSLVIRSIPTEPLRDDFQPDDKLDFEVDDPVTLTDVIHIRFRILCPDLVAGADELKKDGADWGWITTHVDEDMAASQAKRSPKDRKRIEGAIRRWHRSHEIASKKAVRKSKNNPFHGLGSLGFSLLSEMFVRKRLLEGYCPTFFEEDLIFPLVDQHEGEIPESITTKESEQVSSLLHESRRSIVMWLERELTADFHEDPKERRVRGGRKGLVPAKLYRDL